MCHLCFTCVYASVCKRVCMYRYVFGPIRWAQRLHQEQTEHHLLFHSIPHKVSEWNIPHPHSFCCLFTESFQSQLGFSLHILSAASPHRPLEYQDHVYSFNVRSAYSSILLHLIGPWQDHPDSCWNPHVFNTYLIRNDMYIIHVSEEVCLTLGNENRYLFRQIYVTKLPACCVFGHQNINIWPITRFRLTEL